MNVDGGTSAQTLPEGAPGDAEVRQAGQPRSARIESLRALAALAVLGSHVYGYGHGYGATVYQSFLHRTLLGGGFAVFLFFTLTGYLLYLPFARRDFGSGPSLSYRRYALNRAVRILPLYYVVNVVYLIALQHPRGVGTWARYLLFWENFSASTVARLDGPVWSLVIEVHFYLLLPFLALGVASLARRSRPRGLLVLALLGTAGLLVRWATIIHVQHVDPLWQYNLPANFFFFIPGMLLALLRVCWDTEVPDWLRGPLRSSNAWLAASIPLWLLVFDRYNWDPLVGVASFFVVGACVLPLAPGLGGRALDWRPLAVLGTASYSLYLWHLPIVANLVAHQLKGDSTLVLLGVLVPLNIGVALVSYQIVEAPWLRFRRRWQGVSTLHDVKPRSVAPD